MKTANEIKPLDSFVDSLVKKEPRLLHPENIANFFSNKDNLFILGASNESTINKLLDALSTINTPASLNDISLLLSKIRDIHEYLVIGMRGTIGNYYSIIGDPEDWQNLFKTSVNRAATSKKFSIDLYEKLPNNIVLVRKRV